MSSLAINKLPCATIIGLCEFLFPVTASFESDEKLYK